MKGKLLSRVYINLETSWQCFCMTKKPEWAKLFRDEHWIAMLAYLTNIFVIFNDLNLSMQGRNVSLFATADKIDGKQRKLKTINLNFSHNFV